MVLRPDAWENGGGGGGGAISPQHTTYGSFPLLQKRGKEKKLPQGGLGGSGGLPPAFFLRGFIISPSFAEGREKRERERGN